MQRRINACTLTLVLAVSSLFFVFVLKASSDGGEMSGLLLPITYTTRESELMSTRKNAFSMMQLFGMHTNDTHATTQEWVCPTSIVVNATTYTVTTNVPGGVREFEVRSPYTVVARGGYEWEKSAYEAKVSVFEIKTLTSMRWDLYVSSFLLVPLDVSTNSFVILHKWPDPWDRDLAAFGRAWIKIETRTNALEFVTAIMNAGYEAAQNQ